LVPRRGKIDDGETTVPKTYATIRRPPFTRIIRASVAQRITTDNEPTALRNQGLGGDAHDAAH
jgi:hypothetical protein